MKEQFLKVAGCCLQLEGGEIRLPDNYRPFRVEAPAGCPIVCRVTVGDVPLPTSRPCEKSSLDETEELLLYKNGDDSYTGVVYNRQDATAYRLYASSDWGQVTIGSECACVTCPSSVIDKFLMATFIYSSARYRTVLLHASCIRKDTWGVAFIGHSGAGKSTHSRLWLSHVTGTSLLNDDQPAVRIEEDGTVTVYGTPWSGKTPCYKAEKATLKGLFRMVQAPHNEVHPLTPVLLFRELLASCSMMKTDAVTFRMIVATLGKIAAQVPGFILENRPEEAAVRMAYSRIRTE